MKIALTLSAIVLALPPLCARAASPELIAAAKKEGEVVWYTVQTIPQIVTPLVAAFEKAYGVKVTYVRANSSDVALRVLNEAKAGRTLSDVIDGTNTTPILQRENLVASWTPDVAASWPASLVDSQKYWAATNFFVNTIGINTDLVPPALEPKSWDDLLDPRWKGRLAWGSTASSSAGPGFVGLMLKERGEASARALLQKLAKQNIAAIPVAARQVLDQVIAGEYAMGLMMFNHHAVISAAQGAPVAWIAMNPAMSVLSVVSVIKEPPHPNAGKLLVDFLVSEAGQKIYRDADYMPIDAATPARDESLRPDGVKFRAISFTPERIVANMPKWSGVFQQLFR